MIASNMANVSVVSVLNDNFNGLNWDSILAYYQNKGCETFISMPKGAAKHVAKAEKILANTFSFNNETHALEVNINWLHNPSHDLEWLILLHKFYYLKDLAGAYDYSHDERYAEKWVSLVSSWIRQVPDGFIDSQVTGRRLQQWLTSYPIFVCKWQPSSVMTEFFENFLRSVNSQTHYLCKHLTPEGNHRTLELYAIFLVAVTFPELRSAHWFQEFSTQKLVENMSQDLLPDGVHRELSTDYHHTVLKNYLRFTSLAAKHQIALPDACNILLKKAIEFSYYAHKPDGHIPAINDGDSNSYLPLLMKAQADYPNEHLQFVVSKGKAGKLPTERSRVFADSGYIVLRSDWSVKPYDDAHYMFFDCAALGFGSHGHYDALNFELAAYGHSLIVDPGRYTYSEISADSINWRHYFKGTAGHNTVVVDGLDQIPYRCERPVNPEPKTTLQQFVSTTGFDLLQGQVVSHQYSAIHERIVFFLLPEYWIILDRLIADDEHHYDLYLHLASRAQGLTTLETDDCCHLIKSPNLLIAQPHFNEDNVTIEQGYVSPEYGIKHEAPVVKFSKQQAGTTTFHTVLYPFKEEPSRLQVKQLTIYQHGRLCDASEASAIQIGSTIDGTYCEDYFFVNHGAEAKEYIFAGISCSAKMLFMRLNQAGQVVNLQGEGIRDIKINEVGILGELSEPCRISYTDKKLTLTDCLDKKGVMLFNLDFFPDSAYLVKVWGNV